MRRYLEQCGHHVDAATDMASALERLPAAEVDLLISDIGLPDGDGWELLRRLGPEVRFFAVAMSGCGANADRARSRSVGYSHHLLKPFLPDELDAIFVRALEFRDRRNRSGQDGNQ